MTYPEAKQILRDAIQNEVDFETRLAASPGRLSLMDTSTAGELPKGDSFGDQILQSLLVVNRHMVGQKVVDKDLIGILLSIIVPVLNLAADRRYDETRIPQISIILDLITMSSLHVE